MRKFLVSITLLCKSFCPAANVIRLYVLDMCKSIICGLSRFLGNCIYLNFILYLCTFLFKILFRQSKVILTISGSDTCIVEFYLYRGCDCSGIYRRSCLYFWLCCISKLVSRYLDLRNFRLFFSFGMSLESRFKRLKGC